MTPPPAAAALAAALLAEIAAWDTEKIAHLLSHPGDLWAIQRRALAAAGWTLTRGEGLRAALQAIWIMAGGGQDEDHDQMAVLADIEEQARAALASGEEWQ